MSQTMSQLHSAASESLPIKQGNKIIIVMIINPVSVNGSCCIKIVQN